LHGNIGLTTFFYHAYRHTNNKEYEFIASKLLDKVFDNINDNIQINFEDGIVGIGLGLEYLIQNGFVKGNIDEV